jgi:hypothetical protein
MDRAVLNVAVVAVLIALGTGITFVVTGWPVAKVLVLIAVPVALVAISIALARAWLPR